MEQNTTSVVWNNAAVDFTTVVTCPSGWDGLLCVGGRTCLRQRFNCLKSVVFDDVTDPPGATLRSHWR